MNQYIFTSSRIGFRKFKSADKMPFFKMCNDPKVMEFFPALATMEKVELLIERVNNEIETKGHGFFAVDELASGKFMGFIGIKEETELPPWSPFLEAGWRLNTPFWGKGYATEGAKAAIQHAFEKLNATRIYALAPKVNQRSIRVMQKAGMQYKATFEHPALTNHPNLKNCELYIRRLEQPAQKE